MKNSVATSGSTDEHQGESLVLPQCKPRDSDGGLPTDLTLETGFHTESAFEMLQLLGWEGNPADVNSIATNVFKDHLLNYSIEAAQAWGLEFWAQQPEGALETAAELDSTELAKVGNLQRLVEARQARQAHNRLSPERVDRVSERVMRVRTGIHNSLESVNWEQMERDVETLREFGRVGVPILTSPDFAPSIRDDREPQAWAKNYTWAPAAVDALVYKEPITEEMVWWGIDKFLPDSLDLTKVSAKQSDEAMAMLAGLITYHWPAVRLSNQACSSGVAPR